MIVRDSSIYQNTAASQMHTVHGDVKIGIITSSDYDSELDTFFYMVEVTHAYTAYTLKCRQLTKFGDPYNFEEWGFRGIKTSTNSPKPSTYEKRVGEVVIIAHIGGNPYDGVILGTLKHPARETKIKSNTIEYMSEFNGLRTHVDEKGAYKVTFQGASTTTDSLKYASGGGVIPKPQYNPSISGSYLEIDNTGSIQFNDASTVPQYIKIDKSGGKTSIVSGSISIELTKSSGKMTISVTDADLQVKNSLQIKTLKTSIDSSLELKMKSAKIAIGFNGVELIDSIIQIVDAIGTLVVSSPVGPCSPANSAPTWAQLEAIKTKLTTIKGSL